MTHLRFERQGPLAILTLDREDARNAWSEPMLDAFLEALDTIEADDALRVVILTGAGRAFSAGGDLKLMRDHAGMFAGDPVTLRNNYTRGIQRVPRRMARFDKPVIAALNGAAIGAGLDLACMCDIRIAAPHVKLGSTFVKVGLVPGDGGAYLLSRVIGFPRALEMILTGRIVGAEEALSMGLVNAVVPAESLMDTARERAMALAKLPPLAMQLTKSACYHAHGKSLEDALNLAATYQGIVQNTEDHDACVEAILNKQEIDFSER